MTRLSSQLIDDHCKNMGISKENLTKFTIPDSVTELGEKAFRGCKALTSITIPDSVTKIGIDAFATCRSLTSITIPDSVTEIAYRAFCWCKALTSITIPDGVTSIGEAAFLNCEALTSITIYDGVTTINDSALCFCTSLTSITIPDSVTEIGIGAFAGCTRLTQISCNNPDLFSIRNIENKDQIEFISITKYFNENHKELLDTLKSSGFNPHHISSKELSVIMQLHQEGFHPNWNTIATTFNERSMDQIRAILHYFGKTQSMPEFFDTVSLDANNDKPINLNHLSMFLNPIDHARLSRTAKNIILRTKEKTQEQEHPSISELELNMSQLQVALSNG